MVVKPGTAMPCSVAADCREMILERYRSANAPF
jgi:hypothetical protein